MDHYHLHCIVTGGGPALAGSRWVRSHARYLFPVRALSVVFRAKFCEGLQALYAQGRAAVPWPVEAAGRPGPLPATGARGHPQAVGGLWQTSVCRPGASAGVSVPVHPPGGHHQSPPAGVGCGQPAPVRFDYKDYADGARHKSMTLALQEFVRRLRLHFLPARFVKIRHYGLLANRGRQGRLERARALLGTGPPAAVKPQPRALPQCPHCGWAALILVRVIPPPRRPLAPMPLDSS